MLVLEQVARADADPPDLVAVDRPDPLLGRPVRAAAARPFLEFVGEDVVRKDQVGAVGDPQAADGRHPHALDLGDLGQQDLGVDGDARTDHALRGRMKDARREQVEPKGAVLVVNRVAGVVSAVVADHHVGMAGQRVDDLALPLIAPLRSDHRGHRHYRALPPWCGGTIPGSGLPARREAFSSTSSARRAL